MKDINNLRKSNTRKIQSAVEIGFISSEDTDEGHIVHSKIPNIEFMNYDNRYKVIEELFELLLSRYQIDWNHH